MPAFRTALASLAFACWASASALADPQLADFPYPYPVQSYQFRSQGQPLSMAYMDVQPTQPHGKTRLQPMVKLPPRLAVPAPPRRFPAISFPRPTRNSAARSI